MPKQTSRPERSDSRKNHFLARLGRAERLWRIDCRLGGLTNIREPDRRMACGFA